METWWFQLNDFCILTKVERTYSQTRSSTQSFLTRLSTLTLITRETERRGLSKGHGRFAWSTDSIKLFSSTQGEEVYFWFRRSTGQHLIHLKMGIVSFVTPIVLKLFTNTHSRSLGSGESHDARLSTGSLWAGGSWTSILTRGSLVK